MTTRTGSLLIFAIIFLSAIFLFAADEPETSALLKFNCLDSENSPVECEKASVKMLSAMGCHLRNELPHSECVKLTDDTLCKLYSGDCQKTVRANGKLGCPSGFSKVGSLAPTKAIFETSYFCKRDEPRTKDAVGNLRIAPTKGP